MALVEREHHLACLEAALHDVEAGHGRVILCSGPTGCGKSALLRVFAATVRKRAITVIETRASPLQRDLPFTVLRRLLDAVQHKTVRGLSSASVHRPAPESRRPSADDGAEPCQPLSDTGLVGASGPLPGFDQTGDADPDRSPDTNEIWQRASRVLGALSARGPFVLCVDDIQFADRVSLDILLFLLREVPASAALLVLAECESVSPPHLTILGEQAQNPDFERLGVRPLSVEAVKVLVKDVVAEPEADRMSIDVHGATGGNPQLVRALLHDHTARPAGPCDRTGGPLAPDARLERYRQAVQSCIARDEPIVRATAQALAILGPAGTPQNIAGLLGTAPTPVEAAMHALESSGLTWGGNLRHEQAVGAVLAAIPAGDRAALHLRAARLLYDDDAPDLTVAEHLRDSGLVQSAEQPCEPWVIRTLIHAARQAQDELSHSAALEYLSLARLASRGGADDALIDRQLLRARWRDDPATGLRQVADLADAARSAPDHPVIALAAVPYLLWFGRVEEACALAHAWAEATAGTGPGAVADVSPPILELCRVSAAYLYPGWAEKTAALLGPPPAIGGRTLPGDLREVLTAAEKPGFISALLVTEPTDATLATAAAALGMLLCLGDLEAADSDCDLLLAQPAVRDSTMWQALLTAVRAEIRLRSGDLEEAERAAARALEMVSSEGWGVALAGPVSTRVSALVALGRLEEAEELLKLPVPEATAQTVFGLHHRIAQGRLHAAAGRPRAALRDFTLARQQMQAWKLDLPGLPAWRLEAAAAAARCHETALARDLLQEQLAELGERHPALRALVLYRLALLSDPRYRPALLREAITLHRDPAWEAELDHAVRALKGHAQQLAPTVRTGEPKPAQRQAGVPRPRTGQRQSRQAGPAAGHVHPLAQQPPKRGAMGLSRAERRVALLAAAGETNREIADHLYLTVSTVEQHLTRIYRKLGLANRAELKQLDVER